MTPERRLQLLIALTAIVLGGFALDRFLGPSPTRGPDAPGDAGAAAIGTPALAGAPRDLDAEGLTQRYAAILEQAPFEARSFRPKPSPRARPTRRTERPEAPPPPTQLELRLTGLLGHGETRVGVLEERSSGRGILAHPGLALGTLSVAAVEDGGIVLVEGETRRTLELGDPLTLPKELSSLLIALKVTTREPTLPTGRSPGGTQPAVEVSTEDRQAILERLRNRRRNSLQKPQEGGS